jgi:hypothetical protein
MRYALNLRQQTIHLRLQTHLPKQFCHLIEPNHWTIVRQNIMRFDRGKLIDLGGRMRCAPTGKSKPTLCDEFDKHRIMLQIELLCLR